MHNIPLLASTEGLDAWCAGHTGYERVAVDTEGDSLHCYFEKLCLLQLSIPGQDLIVDPLQPINFEGFNRFLSERIAVFHGCDYDLRMLRRGTGFLPGQVSDTYLAARLLGIKEVGLASLVKAFFGLELPKASQKANWARRPLTSVMVAYAVNDTKYLLPIADRLEAGLREAGRWGWYEESCARAVAATVEDRQRDLERVWKIAGSSGLEPRGLAILRDLWFWRDGEAQTADRPAFQIMRNEELIDLVKSATSGERIKYPPWLPSSRRRRLEQTVERALNLPESEWPARPKSVRFRSTPEQEQRLEQLRTRRDNRAKDLGLDPAIIAPRSALEAISRQPHSAPEILMTWQRELLGLED
ncbi:MAG: HRDC domain-containing protein [Verrucomicrobia bacterium]|nr:HRDC domain-containing protein [Verrucomicrobiota bacterium]